MHFRFSQSIYPRALLYSSYKNPATHRSKLRSYLDATYTKVYPPWPISALWIEPKGKMTKYLKFCGPQMRLGLLDNILLRTYIVRVAKKKKSKKRPQFKRTYVYMKCAGLHDKPYPPASFSISISKRSVWLALRFFFKHLYYASELAEEKFVYFILTYFYIFLPFSPIRNF